MSRVVYCVEVRGRNCECWRQRVGVVSVAAGLVVLIDSEHVVVGGLEITRSCTLPRLTSRGIVHSRVLHTACPHNHIDNL